MRKPELLAPAGDWESLTAAVRFGADAVYVGGDMLQLRAKKAGFDRTDLSRAVDYVHKNGKRLYVTVNAIAKNREIKAVGDYARFLRDIGADAAIISDLGVLSEFTKAAPDLERHISTQASCMNYAAANVYFDMGVRRVVLAREITVDEIEELRNNVPDELELEIFVHGAMCMAISGRCLLSSFLTGRSGNRGECAQPCRWNYRLLEEKRPGELFEAVEGDGYSAILSSRDLCCIGKLDQLSDIGVSSFKIEGRMKTAYYVASVVNAYRRAMDKTVPLDDCTRELMSCKHRPYTTGFYFGELPDNHNNSGQYEWDCVFIGNVLGWSDGVAEICQRNRFAVGEMLEILSPDSFGQSFYVEEIRDANRTSVEEAVHPMETVYVPCGIPLRPGDFLRRREVAP